MLVKQFAAEREQREHVRESVPMVVRRITSHDRRR